MTFRRPLSLDLRYRSRLKLLLEPATHFVVGLGRGKGLKVRRKRLMDNRLPRTGPMPLGILAAGPEVALQLCGRVKLWIDRRRGQFDFRPQPPDCSLAALLCAGDDLSDDPDEREYDPDDNLDEVIGIGQRQREQVRRDHVVVSLSRPAKLERISVSACTFFIL